MQQRVLPAYREEWMGGEEMATPGLQETLTMVLSPSPAPQVWDTTDYSTRYALAEIDELVFQLKSAPKGKLRTAAMQERLDHLQEEEELLPTAPWTNPPLPPTPHLSDQSVIVAAQEATGESATTKVATPKGTAWPEFRTLPAPPYMDPLIQTDDTLPVSQGRLEEELGMLTAQGLHVQGGANKGVRCECGYTVYSSRSCLACGKGGQTVMTESSLLAFYKKARKAKHESPERLQQMVQGILGRLADRTETVDGLRMKQRAKYGWAVALGSEKEEVRLLYYGRTPKYFAKQRGMALSYNAQGDSSPV
jgi:hypothetical protein